MKRIIMLILDSIFPPLPCEQIIQRGIPTQLADAPPHREGWIWSCVAYRDPFVMDTVRIIKRRSSPILLDWMAHQMSSLLLQMIDESGLETPSKHIVLVPIPITRKRLRQRGFNQAHELAQRIGKQTGYAVEHPLQRIKSAPKQAIITRRAQRLANMKGVLASTPVNPGTWYIVVDDITTTGATIIEARRALRAAGAKYVNGITFGH